MTDRMLDLVVERTDGVPLFVEELARVVADTNSIEASDQQIPATLADSLMAWRISIDWARRRRSSRLRP